MICILIDLSIILEKPSLVTSYLTKTDLGNIDNSKFIFRFLQFLSFSRGYFTCEKDLFLQKYYVVQFRFRNFMDFLQIENKNHYQHHFQNTIPSLTIFFEDYFRSFCRYTKKLPEFWSQNSYIFISNNQL